MSDYASWPTKTEAARALGVTTKTVERMSAAGKLQQASRRSTRGGADEVVYHPDDVAREAAARQRGPLPAFVVPSPGKNGNGNGHRDSTALATVPATSPATPPGDHELRLLFASALRAVSETQPRLSETPRLFLTLPEAAAISGLSVAYLTRRIQAGTLTAEKDRGWKIRRKDLEAL